MDWYYDKGLRYTHVRVYVHGEWKGTLMFTHAEFSAIQKDAIYKRSHIYSFHDEAKEPSPDQDHE